MMEGFARRNLDASLNRAAEGLRVLMDLVRFGLDDQPGSARFKDLRHALVRIVSTGAAQFAPLIAERDSESDVSRPTAGSPAPNAYREPADLFEANCRRVEEALRSIEETFRLLDPAKAREVEHLRYQMYDLQKSVFPAFLQDSHRRKMDFELYVVTDRRFAGDRPLASVVRDAIRGGAGCIQLREKKADIRTLLSLAKEIRQVTLGEGATFVVNDSLDVALEAGADGVHLGQEDLPLEAARRLAAGRLLIGISTHNREQALEAESGGAGYINIGPVFPTDTKETPVYPVGTALVRELSPHLSVPFTTMGGIHLSNVEEVILAGADRVAVVSEVMAADDVGKAARKMIEAIHRAKEKRGT
jgi:thiamine-phosphate pyrophosphorylase